MHKLEGYKCFWSVKSKRTTQKNIGREEDD
jgi:hypothetical protein